MKRSLLLMALGTWILADAVSSLYTYTGDKKSGQSWIRDHSFRIVRGLVGIALIWMAWTW